MSNAFDDINADIPTGDPSQYEAPDDGSEDSGAEHSGPQSFDNGWLRLGTQMVLMVGFIWLAVVLGQSILPDVRYFFSDAELVEVGRAEELDYAKLQPDSYVKLSGITTNRAAQASVGVWFMKEEIRYFLLAGSRVFVQAAANPSAGETPLGVYTDTELSGRLVRLGPGSGYEHIASFFATQFNYDFEGQTYWLLIVGEEPGSELRYLFALVGVILLILVNLAVMGRAVRRTLRRAR